MKMHDDEADIDAELVRRLVASQFPRLAGLPVTPFRSTGTVNAIYRLGDHLYARLPRVARARGIALHQAVMLIPYYRETNPGMAALGRAHRRAGPGRPQGTGRGRGGTGAECTIEVVVRPCGVNRSRIGSSSSMDSR